MSRRRGDHGGAYPIGGPFGETSAGQCRGRTKKRDRCANRAKVGSDFCHLHQDQAGYIAPYVPTGHTGSAPRKESTAGGALGCLIGIGATLAALWCLGVAIWLVVELIGWLT